MPINHVHLTLRGFRRVTIRLLAIAACMVVAISLVASIHSQRAIAAPGDVGISALSCDSSPEYVRIHNYGSAAQSLSGFHIQSDPSQDYDIGLLVSSISVGQTLEFQSGTGATTNAGSGIYKLTGSFIYRNSPDRTDYARLARSDSTANQVSCGSSPPTPTHSPAPTPTHSPSTTPSSNPTLSPTPTQTAAPLPTASPTPTATPIPIGLIQGDLDCSGHVTASDGLLELEIAVGLRDSVPCGDGAGTDVDCNGIQNAMDALLVFRFAADFSSPANGPCTAVGSPIPQAPVTTPASSHSPTPTPPLGDPPLEIDHIDVGQGNAALIIAPDGETAMIDDGRWTNCTQTVSYVTGKGITHIDYHFATHYDADHIGCLEALVDAGVSVGECLDHGGSKNTQTFANYAAACGANRQTAYKGEVITLDAGSADPVKIKVVDLNGAGVSVSPDDENALGLDTKLTYGSFSHEFGGDMPGESPDIESVVGPEVGHVDVCTVHHHGSKYSSNDDWLNDLTPAVCVLSVGTTPTDTQPPRRSAGCMLTACRSTGRRQAVVRSPGRWTTCAIARSQSRSACLTTTPSTAANGAPAANPFAPPTVSLSGHGTC
jgi:beta-lactamase superfamily II metal-dependent hydrolase